MIFTKKYVSSSVGLVNVMNKVLNVKCPTCDKEFNYYSSEYRPFCCEKCRMIDLGHWFKESYKVPEKDSNPGENQEENHIDENDNRIDEDSEYR